MARFVYNLATVCLFASLIVFVESQNKILGGIDTVSEFFPFQLAIETGGIQVCGASVLTKNWALTAAHCVYGISPRWMVIRAGSEKLLSGGTLHSVQQYVTHDGYSRKTYSYDVAVVEVKQPFVFSDYVTPVRLPTTVPTKGDPTWVAGWGYTEGERINKPDMLRAIDVEVYSREDCLKLYGDNLSETMMCAGSHLDKNTCNGDSGGPLVRGFNDQVGIVSWGYSCGDGLPTVFTNVSTVTDWIMKTAYEYEDGYLVYPTDYYEE